jgi:AcrR family transcriptional regulator
MRAHDSHVKDDGLTEAITGKPATVTLATESVTAGPVLAANVRVPPAAGYALKAAAGPAASSARDAGTGDVTSVPGAGGAWCTDDNTGDIADAGDIADPGRAAEAAEVRDATRRPGRPRSERAEQAIIDATIEALGEYGIDGVRCEDVAARAGVGKATLYRRWSGKEDLLIAAFAAMRRPLPEPRGDSVRADLISLLTVVAADTDDPRSAQQYALPHGAGERYPRLVARYKERVIEPRRERVRSVLRRGIETGELRSDIDVEVAMLMLTGAVMARGKHDPTPAAPGFVESAVDELLLGISSR